MKIEELLKNRRTVRRFLNKPVEEEILTKFIDLARLSPSGANLQSLKYAAVTDKETRLAMFPHIKYAGYTPEWENNFEATPPSFILLFNDTRYRESAKSEADAGIALMALTLLAQEHSLASCIIGAVNRQAVTQILKTDSYLDLLYLIGIGYPDQNNYLYDSEDKVKYALDENKNFKVPKRSLEEITVRIKK